jgi:hypothetical protein
MEFHSSLLRVLAQADDAASDDLLIDEFERRRARFILDDIPLSTFDVYVPSKDPPIYALRLKVRIFAIIYEQKQMTRIHIYRTSMSVMLRS